MWRPDHKTLSEFLRRHREAIEETRSRKEQKEGEEEASCDTVSSALPGRGFLSHENGGGLVSFANNGGEYVEDRLDSGVRENNSQAD